MNDNIDYDAIIKFVEINTKKNFIARVSDNKFLKTVANYGAKNGDIVKLERNGEYYGITVQIMEEICPLLTDRLVCKLLILLKKQEYVTALGILKLTELDQLFYILALWFEIATEYVNDFFTNSYKKKYPKFDKWIKTVSHDPLDCLVKIVDVGCNKNTGGPVVPVEWLEREFNSGSELHTEMDKLEWRIGKPPVTYAVIYSMIIQDTKTTLKNLSNIDYDFIFYLKATNKKVHAVIGHNYIKGYEYIKYGKNLIGFKLSDLLEPKNTTNNVKEVAVLVSRLQKAIRRGRYAIDTLIDTIKKLNNSPNYNLPEHGFMRVSSSKQLVWRLFISILEDCRPYAEKDELGMLEILLLSLITQKCTEYKFKQNILDMIIYTACIIQYNDKKTDYIEFKNLPETTNITLNTTSNFKTALFLALTNSTMMKGDKVMLSKYYSYNGQLKNLNVPHKWKENKGKLSKTDNDLTKYDTISHDVILSSFDHHCKPTIILYYGACIEVSLTTKEISKYIWDISSSYNVRFGKIHKIDNLLREIQYYFYKNETDDKYIHATKKYKIVSKPINENVKKTSFLLLFGQKYKTGSTDTIICGSLDYPLKIKKDKIWVQSNDVYYLNKFVKKTINLTTIDPPYGFLWREKKVTVSIKNGKPYINNNIIPFFDASSILVSNNAEINDSHTTNDIVKIVNIFAGNYTKFENLIELRKNPKKRIKNWDLSEYTEVLNNDLIKLTYTKIFNQYDNNIIIGPIDRSGLKMHNSINYLLEGKLWAVFNLLYYLYPDTFKLNGLLNFKINKNTIGYTHLIDSLQKLIFKKIKINGLTPQIKTSLWDHQKDSVNKIINGFKNGVHGFGNASDVGSGKTLNALAIACKIIEIGDNYHSGILVLLPNNKLINTWRDEITKHTTNFDVIFQQHSALIGKIKKNTIVITTMARIRDHPIRHKWLLLVIDECLSVQNKNALQTEEAWTQSLLSKHLIMMSATFFRTRFDKLYYMLKMLQTGIPEKKEYLDTILVETMVSEVSNVKRKWISNINNFVLSTNLKKAYNDINKIEMDNETKFAKLSSYLVSDKNVQLCILEQLKKLIDCMEKNDKRCLIYARSKKEALLWSDKLQIKIYPEKEKHCIITYNDGTYGLNDLIIYNCIISRPPNADLIPQIKGRLDRPGQKLNTLHIEYFILKDTIEEGLVLRMNIASQFLHKYIMPLAKFYDISLNYKKYISL